MSTFKSDSSVASPASSSHATVDFNRLTLQSPSRSMTRQTFESQMENDEGDDVLIIDQASTPAPQNTHNGGVAAPTNPPITHQEQINAMILDENMTVEEMLNSNIFLNTSFNKGVDNILSEDDLLLDTWTQNKEPLLLMDEAVDASFSVEPVLTRQPEQRQHIDSTVPIHVERGIEQSEHTIAVESADLGVQHQSADPGANSNGKQSFAVNLPTEEKNQSSCAKETFEVEITKDANLVVDEVHSNENAESANLIVEQQPPILVPVEVSQSSPSPQLIKPSNTIHSKRKKKSGLVSSGGISKRRSTLRVKSVFVGPKQESEEAIPNSSSILPTHSTPDSGLGSPVLEIIESTFATDSAVLGEHVQTPMEADEKVELMLTDEITVFSCSEAEQMEATCTLSTAKVSQPMCPSYSAGCNGLKTVPSNPAPIETDRNRTVDAINPPDFQFNKNQPAVPSKSMFGGGMEGISLNTKTPTAEEDAAAKLKSFIRNNFPPPPNIAENDGVLSKRYGQRNTGQRLTDIMSGCAGEHVQYPSPLLKKGGQRERHRAVNAKANGNQQHEVIVLNESDSDQEMQRNASKPSTSSHTPNQVFNSSPTPDECAKKRGEDEQEKAASSSSKNDTRKKISDSSQTPIPATVAEAQKGPRTYFPEPNPAQLHYSSGRYHQGRFFYKPSSRSPLLPAIQPGPCVDTNITVRYGGAWHPRGNQVPNLLPSFIPNIPTRPVNPAMFQQGRPIPALSSRNKSVPRPVPLSTVHCQQPQTWPNAVGFYGGTAACHEKNKSIYYSLEKSNWLPLPSNQIQPRSPERPVAAKGRRATSVVTSVTTRRVYQCEEPIPQAQRDKERSISPNAHRTTTKSVVGDGRRSENDARRSRNYDMIRSSIHQSRTRISHNTHQNGLSNGSRSKSCIPDRDFRSPVSSVRYPNGSLGALLRKDNQQSSKPVDKERQPVSSSSSKRRYKSPSPVRSRHSRATENRERCRSRSRRTNTNAGNKRKERYSAIKRNARRRSESSSDSNDSISSMSSMSTSSSSSSSDERSKRKAKKELNQVLSSLTEKLSKKRSRSKSRKSGRRSVAEESGNSKSSNETNHHRVPSAYNKLRIYQPSSYSAFNSRKRSNYMDEERSKRRRRCYFSSSDTSTVDCERSSSRHKSRKRDKKDDSKALLKAVKTIKKILGK